MRHRCGLKKLGRTASHRAAMLRNLAASIIEHEACQTTLQKAKAVRRVLEPLITLSKEDTVANHRLAFARLRSKKAVSKLFKELGPRFKERPGGYLRILKNGIRPGDAATIAYLELVD